MHVFSLTLAFRYDVLACHRETRWYSDITLALLQTLLHTDNGPQFVSDEFRQFARDYGFHHTTLRAMG